MEGLTRDLAQFNLAIVSKLRGCDVVAVRGDDVVPNRFALDRDRPPYEALPGLSGQPSMLH